MASVGGWLAGAGELASDALGEIRAHKLRSALTLSGIIFGAASLVSMTSLARAMKDMAYRDLESIAFPNSFTVWDQEPSSDETAAAALRHPGLRLVDAEALEDLPGVISVHPRNYGGQYVVASPTGQRDIRIDGIDAGYMEIRNYRIVAGRSLRALDISNVSRVAVVGEELVGDIFGSMAPVGRSISIDGTRFLVVGVVAPQLFEMAPIDFSFVARRIYVPYSWFTRYYQEPGRVDEILVSAADTADFGLVLRRGEILLRQRHRGVIDFEMENEAADLLEDLAMADGILGGWNGVMFAIAGVTLVVGGIGLFSVLLISVRERAQEIGIRKALGADDRDIRRLFLAESLALSILGAVIGVGAGAGLILITEGIGRAFGKSFSIDVYVPGALLAVIFAVVVGIVFGWYPARRAARLDPIKAISGI